jgi:hypothetical protein
MAPLAVHPEGGFAPGPGCCDVSSRKRQRGRRRVNDAGHAVSCSVASDGNCCFRQSPTLGVAVLVASAAAAAVLAALAAVDLATRSAATVLFLAVVAVRLAEV